MASRSGVKAIVSLRDELKEEASERNDSYDEVLQFCLGDTYRETKKKGFVSGVMSAITSIFTAKEGDDDASLNTPINIVKPAIENKVAFLSFKPVVRVIEPPESLLQGGEVPAEAHNLGPAGAIPAPASMSPALATQPGAVATPGQPDPSSFADRLERVVYSLLDSSNMVRRCRDVAWSVSAMDGAVIGVWPDLRHNRPRIFTMTPQDFYPVSYDPDGLELTKALWETKMNGREIESRWGIDKYVGDKNINVIQCVDEEKFYTVIDDSIFAHEPVDNTVGVVPIVCVGALTIPGMIFGTTDIKDAIPVARQLNYHMYLLEKMADAIIEPTILITDPISVPPDLAIGQGGVATAGKDGDAKLLGPLPLPSAFWNMGTVLQTWFDMISDNPAVLRSEGGALITGKGFNAQLGPVAARMNVKMELILAAWKQAIKYMLMMWANFPGGASKQKLSGNLNGDFYYIEATPEEFIVDGKIWTEIDVQLDASSYIDRQSHLIELMQLYQNELIDWDSCANANPYITDRAKVRRNIDNDRDWKAEGMMRTQMAAQSMMTANPDIGQVEREAYGLERGFTGELGAATLPGSAASGPTPEAPEEMPMEQPVAPGMEGPPSASDIVSLLQEFFSGIGKLRGRVWFGGDPVLAPEKFSTDNWTITVWCEDPQDIGTITRAAEKVPEIYGHLRFQRGAPGDEEEAIQVSQSGMAEAAPPEIPPEIAAFTGEMPGEL